MLTVGEAEARAAALIEAALKAGADAADVLYVGDASTSVCSMVDRCSYSTPLGLPVVPLV